MDGPAERPPGNRFARRYDWAEIQRYYDAGRSKRDCMRRFGFASQAWAGAVRRGALVPRPRVTPIDALLARGVRRGRWNLKLRLLAEGLKEHRCERCGLAEWRGRPLSLDLHHENGDRFDNRLENLTLLCPNCHSQTPNYGVGNRATGRRSPRSSP